MEFTFYKYQGTGNDFVMIDNRQLQFDKNNTKLVSNLCNRRFGIGADGLILLEDHPEWDFKMVYYNADGNESSMCGNGGRCIAAFAKQLEIIQNKATFEAIDGLHHVIIDKNMIKLQMQDVLSIENHQQYVFLNTGSPHHVQLENNLINLPIKEVGSRIRYGQPYNQSGTNVNFVKKLSEDVFKVRTYERGVEDETLSCGTGVTAVALAMFETGQTKSHLVSLETEGGQLQVSFKEEQGIYRDIWLMGPAVKVFKGIWTC